jgi:hypothetical protein
VFAGCGSNNFPTLANGLASWQILSTSTVGYIEATIIDPGTSQVIGTTSTPIYQTFFVGGGSGAANNGTWQWTTTFVKSFVQGPSTGPGSCVGLFTDTVTAPPKQIQGAMKNYVPIIVGVMQSALSLTTSFGSYMQMVGDFTSTPAAETAEGVAGLSTVGAAAATAAPYVSAAAPYAAAGGADLVFAYGLGTELKAGFNGQCRW